MYFMHDHMAGIRTGVGAECMTEPYFSPTKDRTEGLGSGMCLFGTDKELMQAQGQWQS